MGLGFGGGDGVRRAAHRYLVEQIRAVVAPTVVVYGSRDTVVPAEQSRAVAEASPALLRAVRVEGADHNDTVLLDGREVIGAVRELVTHLER